MAMPMMADWSLGTTIPAKDLDGTRRFYENVLGTQLVTEDPGGIIYRSGDSYFSLYPTEFAGTAQHTLGAFMVGDVEAAVADLRNKGVRFKEYDLPGLKTVNGIAELGGIKDPEGNILIRYHRRGYGRSSPVQGAGSLQRDAADDRRCRPRSVSRAHVGCGRPSDHPSGAACRGQRKRAVLR